MTDRELMQQALEALDAITYRIERDLEHDHEWAVIERELASEAITALCERLAQPEQEPVATVVKRQYEDGTYAGNALDWAGRNSEDDFPVGTKLYTAPPKREWVGLTDQEIDDLWNQHERRFDYYSYSCDLEAKLKEKNCG